MSLELNDVTLTYPDGDGVVTALDRVSVRVAPGELAAVIGPSGSGKSSLLAVAATLIRPDSGRVTVGDVDTLGLRPRELAALRLSKVGIVFQQPNLIPSLTVVDQLLVTEHMRARSVREARASAMETLAAVGLAGKEHRHPHRLSGGERQRVNIARALVGRPSALLVDEPTAALDHDRGARIMELIEEATRTFEVATLLVTHDTEHLGTVARILEMRDGRLRALDPA
ncbi:MULTISPECIES: ABC transporter ATP-binding protein [Nocardiopsis]|jgi:putative ABC transport system ATP-binding protein|uniref:ATP-binding cassette domain-containing protein n=1 Tax=Nocardiopsis alba TaxID=53437 RepID=A0A7K2IPH1_9ACTN|nr:MULTISPECIES: ABC transporter ATP-binding protein [Nocardiopsis]MEC3894164.1 ABC transporter ATP-binding protein [Nocardiopsis sp. LDBS1602]MYR31776.1 ATP-binding cassette domain-containing protein [Nocardiopsis alba]